MNGQEIRDTLLQLQEAYDDATVQLGHAQSKYYQQLAADPTTANRAAFDAATQAVIDAKTQLEEFRKWAAPQLTAEATASQTNTPPPQPSPEPPSTAAPAAPGKNDNKYVLWGIAAVVVLVIVGTIFYFRK